MNQVIGWMTRLNQIGDNMGKKKLDKQQLFLATEELLLERGYNGFHFRALSEKLKVGRSTIYDYYSNKDELILAYMNESMKKVIQECEKLNGQAPLQRLESYLSVFMQYDQIHQMIQILPMINRSILSEDLKKEIQKLFDDHQKIYTWISKAIDEAKENKEIRKDLPTQLITAIIFSAVQLPNWMNEETQDQISGKMIFDLFHKGFNTPTK
jgi:AcrR family transcriptional regulator